MLRENYRTEHPPLSKIITGLAIAPFPAAAEVPDHRGPTSNWSGTVAHALLMTILVIVIFLVLQRALLRNTLAAAD